MTAASLRHACMMALLLAFVAPASAHAVNAEMQRASISLASKGVAASAAGETERARRLFEEAIVADPANAHALSRLGLLYAAKGEAATARKYFHFALEVEPTEPDALLGAGRLDLADGKADEARDRLRILSVACPACEQTKELSRALEAGSNAAAASQSPIPAPTPQNHP